MSKRFKGMGVLDTSDDLVRFWVIISVSAGIGVLLMIITVCIFRRYSFYLSVCRCQFISSLPPSQLTLSPLPTPNSSKEDPTDKSTNSGQSSLSEKIMREIMLPFPDIEGDGFSHTLEEKSDSQTPIHLPLNQITL